MSSFYSLHAKFFPYFDDYLVLVSVRTDTAAVVGC